MAEAAVVVQPPAPAAAAPPAEAPAAAAPAAAAAAEGGTDIAATAAAAAPPADAAAPDVAPAAAAAPSDAAAPAKQPKRKVAMHLAYLGAGYSGMQRNPGARTIEGELEGALVKAGAISDANAGSFQKIHWNRAARTDKGVSAVCQVVSAKLMAEPQDGFAARVNAHLPDQIRVFGVQRTTEGFDARKFCDKRRYEYILPAWMFDPQACVRGRPDGQAGGAEQRRGGAADKGSSAARLADEAAALAAIAAAVISAPAAAAAEPAEPAPAASDGGDKKQQQPQQQQQPRAEEPVHDMLASSSSLAGEEVHRLQREVEASRQRFVFGDAQLQRLNRLLSQYEGTHNFHNYTVKVASTDPAAKRFMLSVKAAPLAIRGRPWVKIVLVGQSFMLHQIRKMVGMVLAIMRDVAPEPCLVLALDPGVNLPTPMAPELGLFLDETFFDSYNTRFGELHGPVSFEPHRSEAEAFKAAILYPHISDLDDRELVNALWLRCCTDAQFKFTRWDTFPAVRQRAAAVGQQQGPGSKRKQRDAAAAGSGNGAAGAAAGPAAGAAAAAAPGKQQRLERPGKHDGASAAMVVGIQETYGMHPHSDTPQQAAARAQLADMRAEHAAVLEQQHQEQQRAQERQRQAAAAAVASAPAPTAEEVEAELDSLYE